MLGLTSRRRAVLVDSTQTVSSTPCRQLLLCRYPEIRLWHVLLPESRCESHFQQLNYKILLVFLTSFPAIPVFIDYRKWFRVIIFVILVISSHGKRVWIVYRKDEMKKKQRMNLNTSSDKHLHYVDHVGHFFETVCVLIFDSQRDETCA
jgi:hypothetical protein